MVIEKKFSEKRMERFINCLNTLWVVKFPLIQRIDLRYPNGFAISWRESLDPDQYLAAIDQSQESMVVEE